MKKTILSLGICATLSLSAQTTIYTDDFENTAIWNLSAQTGDGNNFVINNVYTGGLVIITNVPNVPAQPTTFSNPDQNYLHPGNILATASGVNNSSYLLNAQGGVMEATLNTGFATTNYENIEVSYWRTGGSGGLTLIYSIDGGTTWQTATTLMSVNPTTWEQVSVTLPTSAENLADLRIGFRLTESNLGNPAPNHYHSIDEVLVTGDPVATQTLTHTIQGSVTEFCGEDEITVDYTGSNGTYNAPNEFQLELSDASGSFATPTTIGTLASTSATGSITGTVPSSIASGTGYRVRVVSTDVAFTGADNGSDLTLNPKPAAPVITQNGTDLSSDYANGNQWILDGTAINGATSQTYSPTTGGDYAVYHTSAAGCVSDTSTAVTIDFTGISELNQLDVQLYPNPFKDVFQLKANTKVTVEVLSITGQLVTQYTHINAITVSTESWPSGVYFVKLTSGEMVKTLKILKQ